MTVRMKSFATVLVLSLMGVQGAFAQDNDHEIRGQMRWGFIPLETPVHGPPAAPVIDEAVRARIRNHPALSQTDEPAFVFPMKGEINVDLLLTGYVDHDSSGNVQDYMGRAHTYDGHRGTDFTLRNFREMDKGVPVFAAEAGVVTGYEYQYFDRNVYWDPELRTQANGVIIDHGNDWSTMYLHLRRNSVTVEIGEEVEKGQLLGYVGSSGFSDVPHLHFEVLRTQDGTSVARDPFEGTVATLPSMWEEQQPYVGGDPLKIFDLGVTTREGMGGNVDNFDWGAFIERPSQPAVFGPTDQSHIVFWFLAQAGESEEYRLDIYRPDDVRFAYANYNVPENTRIGIWYFYWPMNSYWTPVEHHGTWTMKMYGQDESGELVRELASNEFEFGPQTEWNPRFLPAGKSIRINGETQRDTLRMSQFTGDVSYHVIDQPSFVTIEQDSIVVFDGSSDQQLRSTYFQIVATDEGARTDTLLYRVVDPSKPVDLRGTSVDPTGMALPTRITVSGNYPNPFTDWTYIEYTMAGSGHVTVQIFDLLGRELTTLVDEQQSAGEHRVRWTDPKIPSGMYLYRITSEGSTAVGMMTKVQ